MRTERKFHDLRAQLQNAHGAFVGDSEPHQKELAFTQFYFSNTGQADWAAETGKYS